MYYAYKLFCFLFLKKIASDPIKERVQYSLFGDHQGGLRGRPSMWTSLIGGHDDAQIGHCTAVIQASPRSTSMMLNQAKHLHIYPEEFFSLRLCVLINPQMSA